jgi:hypothetical protein
MFNKLTAKLLDLTVTEKGSRHALSASNEGVGGGPPCCSSTCCSCDPIPWPR